MTTSIDPNPMKAAEEEMEKFSISLDDKALIRIRIEVPKLMGPDLHCASYGTKSQPPTSVPDPDPDPHVFAPPGSGSSGQRCGSRFFYHPSTIKQKY